MFACLGVALALHGRRAIRARVLNVASAGASVFMNVIAAAPGWRDLAVWAMPPAAYALASDTLIGVVRTWVARPPPGTAAGLAEEATLLAVAGGLVLWLLRLSHGPGLHRWPGSAPGCSRNARSPPAAAPPARPRPRHRSGRRAVRPASAARPALRADAASPRRRAAPRGGTKTARFLALVTEQHGPLAAIPLESVARISAVLAPQAGLNTGSARAALRRAVLTAQNGDPR